MRRFGRRFTASFLVSKSRYAISQIHTARKSKAELLRAGQSADTGGRSVWIPFMKESLRVDESTICELLLLQLLQQADAALSDRPLIWCIGRYEVGLHLMKAELRSSRSSDLQNDILWPAWYW